MDRVRVSHIEAAEAAGHLRARPITDILWLASKEAIEPETFIALCGVAVAKSCRLVCETPLDALDRLMAAAPGALRVEWLVDGDATDRCVALAAARREWHRAMHEVTRDPAMERIDQLQEEVARISRLLGELAGQPRGGLPGTPASYTPANEGFGDYAGQVRAPVRDFAAMPRSFVPEERTIDRQRAKAVADAAAAADARAIFSRRPLRRPGVGHAARPLCGTAGAAAGVGVEPVHRRRGPRDDRAPLDQDDDRCGPVPA